jgi:ParB-like chromosome segregation protein Spo0J
MAVNLKWREDRDAEFILGDLVGLDWITDQIRLSEIDWKESANNCARLTSPLIREAIEDYHASMSKGDTFPMVVVERSEDGYIILGGNQRCNAAKLFEDDDVLIGAYVVEPLTSADRELIIRSLNSRHGQGATKDERIEHAVFLVQGKGIRTDVAARAMCICESSITDRIRANDTRAELIKSGVDCSKMSMTHLKAMSRLKDPSRKLQLAKAVSITQATGAETEELVRGVEKARSTAAAQKVIAEAASQWAASKAIKKKTGASTNRRRKSLIDLLTRLSDFLETGNAGSSISTMDDAGCSPKYDADTLRVLAAKITTRLNCIMESGK